MKQNDLWPLIVDSIDDGVLVFDPDGALVLANAAARQLFGDVPPTVAEWVALRQLYLADTVTPCPEAEHPALRALAGATVDPIDLFARGPALDEGRWLQLSARPLVKQSGAAVGGLLLCRDIDRQKRAELAQREREQRIHAIIASLPTVLCVTDRDGLITLLSGVPMVTLGPDDPAPVGRSLFTLYAGRPQLLADFKRGLAGETFSAIYDFGGLTLEVHYAPLLDRQGQIDGLVCVGIDMTERRRAEQALRESEDRFRSLIDDLHVGVSIQGPDAEVLLSNRAAQEMLGQSIDQLLGTTAANQALDWDVIQEDGSPMPSAQRATPTAIRTRQPVHNMIMGIARGVTNERRWLLVNAEPQLDSDGSVRQVICTFSDITERKEAEAALRESERRFHAVFDQTFQFISLLSPDGTVLEANQTALDFSGITQAEVIGQPFWQARWWSLAPETQRRLGAAIRDAARGNFVRYEVELRGRGESTGIVDFLLKPVRDERGQVVMLIAEGWDITERKRADAALRESESTLRSFYDSTTLMLGIIELLDDDDILYISNNASAAAFFGLRVGEVDQRRASELRLPRKFRRTWIEHYRESERTGRPVTVEYEQQIGDSTRWLSATVCPIAQSPTDRPRFAYVAEDITERKRTAERISASLREKEVLLQEIHHRVKNNLQVISSLLKLQSSSIGDTRALEMFRESQHRVRSMALVHEKLYQAPDLARIDFADYLRSLTTYLIRSYNVGPLLRLDIHADSVLLDVEQAVPLGLIVNELVSNALKYAFPGGGGQVQIDLRALEPGHLRLRIGDSGVGLPSEIDIWRTESLGLRLVTMLTQQLQGSIELETSPGTTFTLSI